MKKMIAGILVMALMVCCLTGCGKKEAGNESGKDAAQDTVKQEQTAEDGNKESAASGEQLIGKHNVEMKIKDYGTIKLELDADVAPITVTNFVKLVKEGFYDGLTFHRIISGFMIQGGDPLGNGTGGSDVTIKGEFSANGVENNMKHERGVISMARSQDNDSASSQFFIMHQDATHLDGQYAAFGKVTEGLEIVDEICEKTTVVDGNGTVESANQPVIESIKVIE